MARTAFAILLGLVFCSLLAWTQVTTGTIAGVVRDESGAVVPGVAVSAKNLDTGMAREVVTDAQGRYRAPNLPLGNYEVQAGLSGFQTAVRSGITLRVGQEAAVDFTLRVGEVTARVEVTGEAPLVEATRSDVSGVIEERQVSDLPLNGRSYLQLAQLQTGIVTARNSSNISYGGKQTVLATSGSQSSSGLYLLDGTDITDYAFSASPGGASGMAIGVDMIREFRVLTNSFGAEYGRTAGGVLTVVSKSGTNQLEGTALWFHRNDNLDARDFFDGKKPEFKRNQFGGTLGGPIFKDKTFFLGSYEGLREARGRTALALVPSLRAREGFVPDARTGQEVNVGVAPQMKPFLALYPLPTGQTFANGTAELRSARTHPINDDFFSVRIDHVLTEKDTLFGRYTFRDGVVNDPFGSTPVPGFPGIGTNRTQFISAEETRVFSPSLLNTLRVAFNRNSRANPLDPVPDELAISLIPNRGLGPIAVGGMDQLGSRASRPSFPITNSYQVQDNVYLTRGSHSLKLGTDITRQHVNFDYRINFNGSYSFNTLSDFLTARPSSYTGALPGSDGYRGFRWTTLAWFAQDEWRVFPNFTLNLGLRYEFYGNPHEVNGKMSTLLDPLKDTKVTVVDTLFDGNPGSALFQPRFGFAWDSLKNGKLAVRGGFGVYFDRLHANLYNGVHTNPPFTTVVQLNDPPFPKALAAGTTLPPAGAISYNTSVTPRGFSYPYGLQWNFTVQQEIVPTTVVSATYAGSRGTHIVVQGEMNQSRSEIRDGRKFFPVGAQLINPAFRSISWRESKGNGYFHSLQLNLKRRMSRGLQFQTAYTWSKAMDTGTTFGAAPVGNSPQAVPDLYDVKLGRGLADVDVRHNFVFSSSYELPFGAGNRWLGGWQVGGIMSLAAGIPFTVSTGFNQTRDTTGRGGATPPDRVKTVKVDSRNVDRYYDLSAFQLQPAGFFGNAGRNSLIGPGLVNVDFSVIKKIPLTERVNVQWRFEVFNIFNRANFNTPAESGRGGGGSVIFTSANGIPVPTAAKLVSTVTSARQIQMGLKVNF